MWPSTYRDPPRARVRTSESLINVSRLCKRYHHHHTLNVRVWANGATGVPPGGQSASRAGLRISITICHRGPSPPAVPPAAAVSLSWLKMPHERRVRRASLCYELWSCKLNALFPWVLRQMWGSTSCSCQSCILCHDSLLLYSREAQNDCWIWYVNVVNDIFFDIILLPWGM